MRESITAAFEGRKAVLEKLHGKRGARFDLDGVPKGWVVNGRLPQELFEHIRAFAIPVMPGGLNPFIRRETRHVLQAVRQKYHENDAFMLLIPDDETDMGWGMYPVFPTDLKRNPHEVLHEAGEASLNGDRLLSDIKRAAYMAITGQTDTK